jgi:hypothetical protein
MKDVIGKAIGALLCAVLFGPTVVGVLDATWYFYTDHFLTGVNWTEGRIWYAVGMPFLAGTMMSIATI